MSNQTRRERHDRFHRPRAGRLRTPTIIRNVPPPLSAEEVSIVTSAADLGVWSFDPQRGRLTVTDGWRRLFAIGPAEEVTPDTWLQRLHPEDRERMQTGLNEAMTRGGEYDSEYRIVLPDGSVRWLAHRARSWPELGLSGVNLDITRTKRIEETLRDREAQLRLFIEHAPAALAMFDGQMCYLFASQRWRGDYGLGDRPLEGLSHYAVFPEIGEEWKAVHCRALGGEVIRAEADRFPRADGSVQWLRWEVRPWTRSSGEVGGIVMFTEDLTEIKQAEEALRTADQRKNEFLATLSHELRNPLTPIRNSLYILERAVSGSEQALRARTVIERQTQQLTRLIDDLLDMTRISRGKIRLQPELLDLGPLVRGVVEDHREAFQRSGVQLEATIDERPLPMLADSTRLAQVVGNLLGNAAKFTPRGGHTWLTLTRSDGGQDEQATLCVRDDGPGLPDELKAQLFQPFVQGDRTLDRSRGGLGLGLALVRGLVELHGGTVQATSEGQGWGSEFIVRLPLAHRSAVRTEHTPPLEVERPRRRVLVIEDDPDAAQSLKEALELGGHTVAVSSSGPDGLELARRIAPHVVFCDIGLPGMDGHAVARAIRADPQLQHTYLVALSGYALHEDIERTRQAGFDRHIAKPPDLRALERLLAELPQRPSAGRS